MSASFPTSVYAPRTVVDESGVVYKPSDLKTFFAKDWNDLTAEIVAIETDYEAKINQGVRTSDSPTFAGLSVPDYIKFYNTDKNTLLGYQTGIALVAGNSQNTFVGYRSGVLTTGAGVDDSDGNVGLGAYALTANTTGSWNTAIGRMALYKNTTAIYNTTVGETGLFNTTIGSYNNAFGVGANIGNTTGHDNCSFGYGTLYSTQTGINNTAIGNFALYGSTNLAMSGCVGIGYHAGYYELGDNAFYVDNQDRTNTAGDKASALLYGMFNATASSQTLTTNSAFTATYGVNIPTGQTYKINNVALAQANIVGLTTADTPTFAGAILQTAHTTAYSTTALPTYSTRIFNAHSSQGTLQYASLGFWAQSNGVGGLNDQGAITLLQDAYGAYNTNFCFTVRDSAGSYFERLRIASTGELDITTDSNGQQVMIKSLTELTTIAAAATTDTTMSIPATALIIAVSVRVTTVIPTATTFTVTGATSATVFNTAAVSVAANSTDKGNKSCVYYNATAQKVRITPNSSPANNTGRVRVTIHYIDITPPTS